MKVYLIAGEPSGDALGARLIKALRKKTNGNIELFGVGGEAMEQEGLHSLYDISDLSVMGLWEVVPSIPRVLSLISQTVEDIKRVKPDIVVTIDSWSFSSRVHKKLRGLKLNIPQVHYVAPQVWAWKKKRARTMHKYIDLLLTLLPQEPKYFTPYGLETVFVGHPVIESDVAKGDGKKFRKKYNIPADKRLVAILPGSRHNEVSRLLPVFVEAAKKMNMEEASLQYVIPTVRTVSKRVKNMLKDIDLSVTLVEDVKDRHDAFKALDASMAASGTVSLELAIADVPHIIAYKVSPVTALLVGKFINIQFVNLVNILLGREIIPELIQERATDGNIKNHMLELIRHGDLYNKEKAGFKKVREVLGVGEQTPSEKAAEVIISTVSRSDKDVS